MRNRVLWEVLPIPVRREAYLLFKDAGRAQKSVRKAEHGLPDDAGACPPTTEWEYETDRILTVLSADHGLLTMKAARGAGPTAASSRARASF